MLWTSGVGAGCTCHELRVAPTLAAAGTARMYSEPPLRVSVHRWPVVCVLERAGALSISISASSVVVHVLMCVEFVGRLVSLIAECSFAVQHGLLSPIECYTISLSYTNSLSYTL